MDNINNIVVFDGIKEYNIDEINFNMKIRRLVNTALIFNGFPTLIERINYENGLIYIITNPNFTECTVELKNVSSELYDLWCIIRP